MVTGLGTINSCDSSGEGSLPEAFSLVGLSITLAFYKIERYNVVATVENTGEIFAPYDPLNKWISIRKHHFFQHKASFLPAYL